tara:strand:+ start:85 stop:300 length:216 start_codon:yes stop_codon:yes gene_type:complete
MYKRKAETMRVIKDRTKDGKTLAIIKLLREGHENIIIDNCRLRLQKDYNGVEHLVTQHRDGKILSIERIEQ